MDSTNKPKLTRMSDELSKTVLYFDSNRKFGFAKSGGVSIDLEEIPSSIPLPKGTTNVSFYHEVHDYRLKEATEATREMRPPEIEAVHEFLSSIADFGRKLRRSWRKA